MPRSLALLTGLALLGALLGYFLAPKKEESIPVASPPSAPADYAYAPASRDGIGKFYLGREIAHVMGHQAISWLERDNREDEEAPSAAIAALQLQPDDVIADIGAGSGYYSFRLAPLVPEGQVIAIDIQPEMVDYLTHKARAEKVSNLRPHLSTITSLELPANSLDAAVLVDVYHEFSHPVEMLSSLATALRPGGRIFLLEYRAEDPKVRIKPLHKMTEAQAITELTAAGFQHLETLNHLPWQHLMVFQN